MKITETDLVLPAVIALAKEGGEHVTTAQMVTSLATMFKPLSMQSVGATGKVSLQFDRKVRNLKSHRTLAKLGLAEVSGVNSEFYSLTEKGRVAAEILSNVSAVSATVLAGARP